MHDDERLTSWAAKRQQQECLHLAAVLQHWQIQAQPQCPTHCQCGLQLVALEQQQPVLQLASVLELLVKPAAADTAAAFCHTERESSLGWA